MNESPFIDSTDYNPIAEAMQNAAVLEAPVERAQSLEPEREPEKPPPPVVDEGDRGGSKPPQEYRRFNSPCPVQPLGHAEGVFFFITPSGQIQGVTADKLGNKKIIGLFEGHDQWLFDEFASYKMNAEGGFDKIPGKWNAEKAHRYLIGAASEQGLFNPLNMLRGAGVWRSRDGELIVHGGSDMLVPSSLAHKLEVKERYDTHVRVSAGCKLEGKVYPASAPEILPDLNSPATEAHAAELLQMLKSWHWDAKHGSHIWLGFTCSAMLSGALKWRPHIHVTGDAGSGKTELAALFDNLHGENSVVSVSAPTEAGVRQLLRGAARPVKIDEVEPDVLNNRAQMIQELARLASSDDQAPSVRGSSEGRAQSFPIRGSFYMSSILYPEPKPQDKQRITFLELNDLATHKGALKAEDMVRLQKMMASLAARFKARMILGYDRVIQNIATFRSVLADLSYTRREADQLAPLLACAEAMLHDEPIGYDEAEILVTQLGFDAVEHVERDHDECLAHLLTCPIEQWRGGAKATVGELFLEAAADKGKGTSSAILKAVGIALIPGDDKTIPHVRVANRHNALQSMFERTRWSGGVWRQAFERIWKQQCPGVEAPKQTVSFVGVKAKAAAIPLDYLLEAAGKTSGSSE